MLKKVSLAILLGMLLLSNRVSAEEIIKAIRFEGNQVTQPSVMFREMYLAPGDELDENALQKSIQGIMDLRLFRSVDYYLESEFNPLTQNDDLTLVIVVVEKFYWIVLPRAKLQDDEQSIGVQVQWDNLFGLNHSLSMVAENKGQTHGVTERQQRMSYRYPFIFDSPYRVDMEIAQGNTVDDNEVSGFINRKDQRLTMKLFRWMNADRRSNGWFSVLGFDYMQRQSVELFDNGVIDDTDALALNFEYGFDNVHQYAYNRGGKGYGYKLLLSDEQFGSKSHFTNQELYYRSYYRFKSRPDENLNVRTRLGHSTGDILDDAAYTLGSNRVLRGFDNNRFEGNSLLLINMEYIMPSSFARTFRYVYFLDLGNTYAEFSDMKSPSLNKGIGLGFRWKLPMFVNVDLRMDAGYAIDDDNFKVSFGTKQVF